MTNTLIKARQKGSTGTAIKQQVIRRILLHFSYRAFVVYGASKPASQEMETWLETPNPAFDNRTPAQLLESGDFEPLLEMIKQLEEGSYE